MTRALLNRRPDALQLGREPLDWGFLHFIWTFPETGRRQLETLRAVPGLQVVVLRSDREARAWLAGV